MEVSDWNRLNSNSVAGVGIWRRCERHVRRHWVGGAQCSACSERPQSARSGLRSTLAATTTSTSSSNNNNNSNSNSNSDNKDDDDNMAAPVRRKGPIDLHLAHDGSR